MFRKRSIIVSVFIAIFIIIAFITLQGSYVPLGHAKVIPNVYAGEVELSEMTRDQGINELSNLAGQIRGKKVSLKYKEYDWELSLKKINVEIDKKAVMEQAMEFGHRGNPWQRWQEKKQVRANRVNLPLVIEIDKEKLRVEVESLLKDFIRPPQDAGFKIIPGETIKIIPGKKGLQVDIDKLYNNLCERLSKNAVNLNIEIPVIKVSPSRTTEDVQAMGLKGLVSSYSTKFDPEEKSRTYNIKTAASALDGLLVSPGEKVSFNKVVGPRSSEAGYKNAKVILNRKLVEGLGGGVCQVSSTLYNAVLLSDLTVIERTNHSLPVSYVPLGRDATVVYDFLDLRFRNDSDSYILIKSEVEYDTLCFKIYGSNNSNKHVSIETWVEKVIEPGVVYKEDSDLDKDDKKVKQEGIQGYKVCGRIVLDSNGEEDIRPLPESYYEPRKKIIAVGVDSEEITGEESEQEENQPEKKEKEPEKETEDNDNTN
ncbi:MAG: VanW family protein [Clostridiales bacterium]|nr:VanW family protein [Clostridiales bacterium]MCF8021123.1 VanW family protein [Clostridiales bacterium]